MDDGEEGIDDAALRAALRRQARKVQIQTLVAAAALTALALVF
jgi:hypothetical protein